MQISSAFSPREFAMACIRGQTDLVVLLLLRLLVLLLLPLPLLLLPSLLLFGQRLLGRRRLAHELVGGARGAW